MRTKIDDYFTRCALAGIDARAITILGGTDADFAALATQDLSASNEQVAKLPLVRVDLYRLLNNFVTFAEFYGRRGAAFQVGTL